MHLVLGTTEQFYKKSNSSVTENSHTREKILWVNHLFYLASKRTEKKTHEAKEQQIQTKNQA